ncbi:nucleoside deaminase [Colwellia piezophila]|uniref:nucleoside deaminase n=1 Tax=Colwellia piezophila TaxID=211668 RepID=UPI00036C38B0|nr:nucleoside deaminase [Colwellia piezophila]
MAQIMSNDNEKYIRECYTLARRSVKKGNHPFGALLVHDNKVILTAENTVLTDNDKTRHAETNLVSRANKEIDPKILEKCTLYTSTEPCIMCCGAIYWSGISKVVFGCSAQILDKIAGKTIDIDSKYVFSHTVIPVEIEGHILEAEGKEIHESYWKQ